MKCPYCGDQESKVIDSRHSDDLSIRRRRECCRCGHRFTTYESVESQPILVVKRNGSRQNFDKNKIVNSMIRAFDKRRLSDHADSGLLLFHGRWPDAIGHGFDPRDPVQQGRKENQ